MNEAVEIQFLVQFLHLHRGTEEYIEKSGIGCRTTCRVSNPELCKYGTGNTSFGFTPVSIDRILI